MATTAAGNLLTDAHRRTQARLGATTVRALRSSWAAIDPTDVDASTTDWLRVAVPIVQAQRAASARLATTYLQRLRGMEVPGAPRLVPFIAADVPVQQVITSLLVTGPYSLKAASARGVPLTTAATTARDDAAGAALRLTLGGGRDTITATVADDPKALGWARATSGDPCAFCAALASRGPVYSEDSVDFEAHDHCACSAEPIYHRDAEWPAGSRDFRDLWDRVAKNDPDPLNAFRRALATQRAAG